MELSIESVSSPQMQLNRTCRREVHLAVLLVSLPPREASTSPREGKRGGAKEGGGKGVCNNRELREPRKGGI